MLQLTRIIESGCRTLPVSRAEEWRPERRVHLQYPGAFRGEARLVALCKVRLGPRLPRGVMHIIIRHLARLY